MKIKLTSDVKHDGKRYAAGDVVDLPPAVATRLVRSGAADLPEKEKAADTGTGGSAGKGK